MRKKLYGKVFRLYGKAFRTNGEVFHVYGKLFHIVFSSYEGSFLAIIGIFMMVLRQFWDAVQRKEWVRETPSEAELAWKVGVHAKFMHLLCKIVGFKTLQRTEKNARFAKKCLYFVKKNVKSEIYLSFFEIYSKKFP